MNHKLPRNEAIAIALLVHLDTGNFKEKKEEREKICTEYSVGLWSLKMSLYILNDVQKKALKEIQERISEKATFHKTAFAVMDKSEYSNQFLSFKKEEKVA